MKKVRNSDLVVKVGLHFVNNNSTVRATAEHFGLSKTTVHNYLVRVLPQVNTVLADQVRNLLDTNMQERHIRGGQATKQKSASINRKYF
jgi:putative DeoR family transcriptional regulator (stage III sporulation protein D)